MKTVENKQLKTYANLLLYSFKNNHRGNNPIHQNLLSKYEIKCVKFLVENNLIARGTDPNDGRKIIYYYDGK